MIVFSAYSEREKTISNPQKGKRMKQNLKITVAKVDTNSGTVACRKISVREKILRLLLGKPQKITVIVSGDNVEEIAIKEIPKEGIGYAT